MMTSKDGRVTVRLTETARKDLEGAMRVRESGQTETVNDAIRMYALILNELSQGAEVIFKYRDGKNTKLYLL